MKNEDKKERYAAIEKENKELKVREALYCDALSELAEDILQDIRNKYSESDLAYPSKNRERNNDLKFLDKAFNILSDPPSQSIAQHDADVQIQMIAVCSDIVANHLRWQDAQIEMEDMANKLRKNTGE